MEGKKGFIMSIKEAVPVKAPTMPCYSTKKAKSK